MIPAFSKALTACLTFSVVQCGATIGQKNHDGLQNIISNPGPVNGTLIGQFPTGYIPENLILRECGDLVVLTNSPPGIYAASTTPHKPLALLYNFTHFTAGGGLIQLQKDVFAVGIGNASVFTGSGTRGSWSLWQIDLRNFQPPTHDASRVVVTELLSVPEALTLDGLVLLNESAGLVAATDYLEGTLRLIDLRAKSSSLLANSTLFEGMTNSPNTFSRIGANGLKYANGSLYFTTSGKDLYGSIPIDTHTGRITGPIQSIFNYTIHLDDFNLAANGNAYLSTLDTPNGGIIRRAAGTPAGQNGSSLVVSYPGPNAVVLSSTSTACTLYFLVGQRAQVAKATLTGSC